MTSVPAALRGTVHRWWLAAFLGGCAVALLPWTVLVNLALPSHKVVSHWDTAWTGFDIVLGLVLGSTAWTTRRCRPAAARFASSGATLLVCDAWFDILTSSSSNERIAAVVEAAVAELPLAAICLLIAHRPERFADPAKVRERLRLSGD